jgi:Tol biopolymer transport system component/predicted Ser/Thr protein kinase
MGEVYLALDTKLNRKAALKFLPLHLCQDDDCRKRFTREAQAAAGLDHPNIAAIHEVGEHQGRPFFAMQIVEGQSLREVIAGKDLPIEQVLEIAIQVCEGLQAAHDKGIIHRDIKPSNILLDSHGRVRIVDFGLASVRGSEQLTKTGSTLGTVGYMSPEQVRGQEVDHRSDLFSLGVVIYELLTKQNPFRRDSEAATLKAVSDDNPHPAARYRSELPDALQPILEKALDKEVKTRYQHADDLKADLVRINQRASSQRTASQHVQPGSNLTMLTLLILAVAVIVIGIVLVIVFHGGETHRTVVPEFKKITYSGDAYCGAIAPDGTYYAYSKRGGDGRTLTINVGDFGGGQEVTLWTCAYVQSICWSPDGKELLLRAAESSDAEDPDVYIIPRFGGTPRRYRIPGSPVYYWDLAWMPDGEHFFSVAQSNRLIFADKSTGDTTVLLLKKPFRYIEIGSVSPDGRWLTFLGQTDTALAVWIANLSDGSVYNITNEFYYSPTWSPKGDAIYGLDIKGGSNNRIVRMVVDLKSAKRIGEPEVIVAGLPTTLGLSISSDGKKLLCRQNSVTSNLRRVDLTSVDHSKTKSGQLITNGTAWIQQPCLSPDGQSVLYISEKANTSRLFIYSLNTGKVVQLTHSEGTCWLPQWSPDGNQIAFMGADANYDSCYVAVMNSDGTSLRKISSFTCALAADFRSLNWPVSDTIMIGADDGKKVFLVNPQTADTSSWSCEKLKDKIYWPRLSPDKHWLSVTPGTDILLYSLEDSTVKLLTKADAYNLGWSQDSKWIRFITKDRVVAKVHIETGAVDTLAKLPEMDWNFDGNSVTVSNDEAFLIYIDGSIQRDLYLIENFDPHAE